MQRDSVPWYSVPMASLNLELSREGMRAVRTRQGLTQREMAGILRLEGDTVRKYESGARVPSGPVRLIYALIHAGAVDVELLMEGP